MTLHDVPSERSSARLPPGELRWAEGWARSLIEHAACKAPPALSARLAEEWLADLPARRGAIARLRFALGCCWASRVIAHELGAALGATAASTTIRTAALYTSTGPSFDSRRSAVSFLIVSLHVLVIYGLAAGMARTVLESPPDRMQVSLAPKAPAHERTASPVNPQLAPVEVQVAEQHWTLEVPLEPVAVAEEGARTREFTAASPPPPVKRVLGGPGAGFPNTADYYPDASRRLGEKGSALVQVCVDATGRLMANPTLAQSSGSTRLDTSALRLARAGSGHYRATTEDGKPASACYPLRVRFELKE
jgi:TonB family protein